MKKKFVTALFTFMTAATLTACSFEFEKYESDVNTFLTQFSTEMEGELSEKIDNTDFHSEEALSDLNGEIKDWADVACEENENLGSFKKAKLVRVVDGDTIVVELDGEAVKVRLIGINTPESVASEEYLERTGKENTKEGKDASDYVKELLADVDVVYLQTDISDTDRYGRLLRYVWLEVPENETDIEEISTKMLNGILVYNGIAESVAYEPDTYYMEVFDYLEEFQGEDLE